MERLWPRMQVHWQALGLALTPYMQTFLYVQAFLSREVSTAGYE